MSPPPPTLAMLRRPTAVSGSELHPRSPPPAPIWLLSGGRQEYPPAALPARPAEKAGARGWPARWSFARHAGPPRRYQPAAFAGSMPSIGSAGLEVARFHRQVRGQGGVVR